MPLHHLQECLEKGIELYKKKALEKLENIRNSIRQENISYNEIAILSSLKHYIPEDDVELLQWINCGSYNIGDIVTTKEIRFKNNKIQYPSKTGEIVLINKQILHIKSKNEKGMDIITICRIDQIE